MKRTTAVVLLEVGLTDEAALSMNFKLRSLDEVQVFATQIGLLLLASADKALVELVFIDLFDLKVVRLGGLLQLLGHMSKLELQRSDLHLVGLLHLFDLSFRLSVTLLQLIDVLALLC